MSPKGTRLAGVILTGLLVFTILFSLSKFVNLLKTLTGVEIGVDAIRFGGVKSISSSAGLLSILDPASTTDCSSSMLDSERESNSGKLSICTRSSCSFLASFSAVEVIIC